MKFTREFYEKTLMDSVRSHVYDYKSDVALSKTYFIEGKNPLFSAVFRF